MWQCCMPVRATYLRLHVGIYTSLAVPHLQVDEALQGAVSSTAPSSAREPTQRAAAAPTSAAGESAAAASAAEAAAASLLQARLVLSRLTCCEYECHNTYLDGCNARLATGRSTNARLSGCS